MVLVYNSKMKQKQTSESGFAHFLILFIIVLVVIAFAGYKVFKSSSQNSPRSSDKPGSQATNGTGLSAWTSKCSGTNRVGMTHSPMDLTDVSTITPIGLVAGGHVTPIDHLYFYPKANERDASPVYAMADGYIKEVESRGKSVGSGNDQKPEYRIVMQHSCQTISYFDLVTSIDPALQKQIDSSSKGDMHIPIKSGQIIGRIGGQSLDTAVYNMNMTLSGFIHPDLYKRENWKIHTDDFYEYFSGDLKASLLAMNQRKVKPYGGKIDYDQPGKLIGNWFLEGTNGYEGAKNTDGYGKDGHGYWDGHLAIFYHAIYTNKIIISTGTFGDQQPQAFEARGNTPDPATISVSSGVVKYDLLDTSQGVDPNGKQNEQQSSSAKSRGTALFQVLAGEKLRVEFFPGTAPSGINGFTSAAKTYER